MNRALTSLILCALLSCSNNQHLKLGDSDDVVVNVEIRDKSDIKTIVFRANGLSQILNPTDLDQYTSISFGFDALGEGTFTLCVFSANDSICSEHYVESGYRPKLSCTANEVNVKTHLGLEYE